MIPFANWLWFSICVGFIITCELYLISRALHLFLIVVLSSLYWMIPWKPYTKKRMWSTKTFSSCVQTYLYSNMKQIPFNLPHTGEWQLEKDSLEWAKSKEGTFLDDFPVQPIMSTPCTPCGLVFHDFFFLNNSPYPLRGERTSVCFQLRKCSDINAPLLPPYF